ncbi:Putative uncharacterized protein [Thermobacillus xylanilyticus]|uniref:Uncharacterized protein n=1 Tax=Thermobacillus xylanilyticus TaxID=76633 RepID=A0ABM8V1E7_THEXY|nr:hypothetical protein [Thermobacillus xylanilyticus]CAG5080855.1 Putative uncharacterized protein [Thermobacillus xylanilyticus]
MVLIINGPVKPVVFKSGLYDKEEDIVTMSHLTEYAKIVRIKTGNLSDKGFKAKLTLPNGKTLPRIWDYINFYVGIDGYECGLSCRDQNDWKQNGVLKWRIFANGEGSTTYGSLYADGSTVTISIELNDQKKVVYKVNDVVVRTFNNTVTNVANSARLVFASYQSTGVTPPLQPWSVFHNQVRAFEMKYKNSSNSWVPFTNGNNVEVEEWPTNLPSPDGKKYVVDKTWIGNADIYASLKA